MLHIKNSLHFFTIANLEVSFSKVAFCRSDLLAGIDFSQSLDIKSAKIDRDVHGLHSVCSRFKTAV